MVLELRVESFWSKNSIQFTFMRTEQNSIGKIVDLRKQISLKEVKHTNTQGKSESIVRTFFLTLLIAYPKKTGSVVTEILAFIQKLFEFLYLCYCHLKDPNKKSKHLILDG